MIRRLQVLNFNDFVGQPIHSCSICCREQFQPNVAKKKKWQFEGICKEIVKRKLLMCTRKKFQNLASNAGEIISGKSCKMHKQNNLPSSVRWIAKDMKSQCI